ncbi:uncharacterized protein [Venturia canescens]|uniref:uncharacterized protein isoform X3 n=1 Tax=Venturia canescens TaxID=32260 RepID=UPI001C9D532B|nr:uncharacterized protein LOC122406617 isoform X3 [Venturia canescens]
MDLHYMERKADVLFKTLETLEKLCNKTTDDSLCSTVDSTLKPLLKKVSSSITAIYNFVGTGESRNKRGLINGLGTVIKAMTGNLDQDDAEKIDKNIDDIITRQKTDEDMLKENVQILQSTLKLYNESTSEIIDKMDNLMHMIERIKNTVEGQFSTIKRKQMIDENINIFTATVEAFTSDVNQLANFLTEIYKGTINPTVISPKQLADYLIEATPYIPKGLNFPTNVKSSEMTNLLKTAEITSYTAKLRFVLIIKFPLIESSILKVNKVYPLPTKINENQFQFIETTSKIIIVDNYKRMYITMSEEDLNKARKVDNIYYYKPKQSLQTINGNTPCEIAIYLGNNPEKLSCNQRIVKLEKTLIIALEKEGRWLFVAPKPESVRIDCKNKSPTHEIIHNTGLLALDGECSATSINFQLLSLNELRQHEFITFIPLYNLTNAIGMVNANHSIFDYSVPSKVIINPLETNALGERIEILKKKLDEEPNIWAHPYHIIGNYSISAISMTMIILIIIILTIFKAKHCQRIRLIQQTNDIELAPTFVARPKIIKELASESTNDKIVIRKAKSKNANKNGSL